MRPFGSVLSAVAAKSGLLILLYDAQAALRLGGGDGPLTGAWAIAFGTVLAGAGIVGQWRLGRLPAWTA